MEVVISQHFNIISNIMISHVVIDTNILIYPFHLNDIIIFLTDDALCHIIKYMRNK